MTQWLNYLSEKYQQESVDEINRRLLELSSLFEISQLLNESLELSRVLNNVLFIPMGRLMIPRGVILLKRDGEFKVVMAKGIADSLKERRFDARAFENLNFEALQSNDLKKSNFPQTFIDFTSEASLGIMIPFISNNSTLGMMLFGSKLTGKAFSDEEIDFLKSLANLSASTITNALQLDEIKQINRQLDERIHELKTLFDIGKGLSSTLEFNKILKLLAYALMGQMLITRYAVLLCEDQTLSIHENKGFDPKKLAGCSKELMKMAIPQAPTPVAELSRKSLAKRLAKIDAHCIIPLQHQDKLLGYIMLGNKITGQEFSATDLEFLTTLVSQAVISMENARLFEETLEKQRLEEELNLARNIQKKLLPKSIPDVEGYEIHGMNTSSKQVGGDYFDVIQIDEHRTALAIADVSGKGVPASLLMANMQAALRVMMIPGLDLPEVVAKLNALIHSNTDLDKFITFFIGILDTRDHSFEYVNAGHNNPHFLTADGQLKFLDIGGILLGIMPSYSYNTGKIMLNPGDLVLTYTDGVNEAMSPDGEEFGDPRLNDLSLSLYQQPVVEIVEKIWETIDDFSAGEPQADDVTMLAVKRLS